MGLRGTFLFLNSWYSFSKVINSLGIKSTGVSAEFYAYFTTANFFSSYEDYIEFRSFEILQFEEKSFSKEESNYAFLLINLLKLLQEKCSQKCKKDGSSSGVQILSLSGFCYLS